jgi:DNA-binding MarR family transcriptional regulator
MAQADATLTSRLFVSVGALEHTGMLGHPNASKGEMAILGTLNATGTPLSPSELARLTSVTPSRTANTLKMLERKGFITRDINPGDRRGIVVSITEKGSAYEKATRHEAEAALAHLLSLLDKDEAGQLVALVEKLSNRAVAESGIEPPPISARR